MKENGYIIAKNLIDNQDFNYDCPNVLPFVCWENCLDCWFPRLDTEINLPETFIIKGYREDSGMPKFDIDRVKEVLSKLKGDVFLRSNLGSAAHLDKASFLNSSMNSSVVEEILMENVFHTEIEQNLYMGKEPTIVLREKLSLDFKENSKNHGSEESHPHARFFIRNGEVKSWYNRINSSNDDVVEFSRRKIGDNLKELERWAKVAAKNFGLPYSIDFVMDTNDNWYCIDMALDGIYWNSKKDKWHEISAHEKPLTETQNNLPNKKEVSDLEYYSFP